MRFIRVLIFKKIVLQVVKKFKNIVIIKKDCDQKEEIKKDCNDGKRL